MVSEKEKLMSEGLQALERIENTLKHEMDEINYQSDLSTIKEELEENDAYIKTLQSENIDFGLEIMKLEKALEIIKEKTLTINDLYWLKNGDYNEYRKNLEILYSGVEEEHLQKILKTPEEFDLLKEVLL